MTISSINTSRLNEDNDTKVKRTQLSPNDFMTLMLAQLKMQDPSKPYDNTAMLQNMAQISSLNSTQDLQATIKSMNTNLSKSQVLSASQLVGKNVALPSDVSPLVADAGLNGSIIVPQPASAVTVTIKDSNNQDIRTLSLGSSAAGVMDFKWDGTDETGKKMDPGFYHIAASVTLNGKPTSATTAGIFKVNSVALNQKDGEVILNVDGMGGMKMNDILKIL
jgi:flagellar basal-body rod modification protein FlgD